MTGSAFTVTYKGIARRLTSTVKISESPAEGTPDFKNEFTALWDTGATSSVITQGYSRKKGGKKETGGEIKTSSDISRKPPFAKEVAGEA